MSNTLGRGLLGLLLAGAVLLSGETRLLGAGGTYTVSYKRAMAEAKRSGKVVLADFTGSDWCGWCIKLKNEVFKTAAFRKWATENVVFLEVDFPRTKAQPAALKRQNQELAKKYGIRGYPTILFLGSDGSVIGRSSYKAGGPGPWIASAKEIIARAPKPATVQPLTDLSEAIAAANEKKQPLLVLAGRAKSTAAFKGVLGDEAFARFVEGRVVVVQVASDAPTSENGKALAALRKKVKARGTPTQILVIGPDGQSLLYAAAGAVRAGTIQAVLVKALPKQAYDGSWLEDFQKAKDLAVSLKRPILIDFTGSDWCGWCMKLDREVFSTPQFKRLAKRSVILMKVDLPRKKKLPADVLKQNRQLAQKFGVRGFPTLVLVDASGTEKRRIGGFPSGGLKQVTDWIKGGK